MRIEHVLTFKRLCLCSLIALALNIANAQQKQAVQVLPNYTLKYSVTTSAKKEVIWQLWEDVENWKDYDTILKYSYLEDGAEFTQGAIGYVKGKGAPKTKFKLIKVNPGISFTERLYVPLYQAIDLQRYFEESPEGTTTFTHEVNFKGRLSFLIYAVAGGAFKRDLPLVMSRMKALAESNSEPPEPTN